MITLSYPAYNPTVTLELDSPEKGDQDTPDVTASLIATQSGSYKSIIFRPHKESYLTTLVFSSCKHSKEEILDFFKQACKHYVKYIDYDGEEWICQVLNQTIDIVNTINSIEYSIDVRKWQ